MVIQLEGAFRSQVFTNVALMKGYDGSGISMSAVLGRLSGNSKSLWKERRRERGESERDI